MGRVPRVSVFSSLLVKSRNAATAVRSENQLAFLPSAMRFQVISGNEQGGSGENGKRCKIGG